MSVMFWTGVAILTVYAGLFGLFVLAWRFHRRRFPFRRHGRPGA